MSDAAELFEAISHPTRIKILRILEREPSSFASLKRQLGIDSSGNLDHHLKKLGQLIKAQSDGLYALTDAGKEALLSISTIEVSRVSKPKNRRSFHSWAEIPRSLVALMMLEGLIGVLSLLCLLPSYGFVGIYYYVLNLYVYSFIASCLSAVGLLKARDWAWVLVIIQSLLLIWMGVQAALGLGTELAFYAPHVGLGFLRYALAVLGGVTLALSLTPSVREVLGAKSVTALPRRPLAACILSILSVVLDFAVGGAISYGRGGWTGFVGALMFMIGLPIVVGALLVVLRRFLVGGLVLVATSCMTFSSYLLIGATIVGYLRLPPEFGLVLGLLVFSMPFSAGILSLTSRPRLAH